ncbi:endonuclease/exonuclease/phosphatase family protein [Kitasatospora sp. NPDC094016]|uniref:endonuclease/exonuclease/phosphatase family protein n=1 Tax=Kitasatospora sp. NPDC094016 TaxID=3154986 RepID=UPI003326508D
MESPCAALVRGRTEDQDAGADAWAQDVRAGLFGNAGFLHGHDVVVLQEMFSDAPAGHVLGALSEQGYKYQTPVIGRSTDDWNATNGNYNPLLENGGVVIVSTWPLVHKEQFIYRDGHGADWWANKGFAYVILNVAGKRVHVVGTHTQSDDPDDQKTAREVRARQLVQLDSYLTSLSIPSAEPVVVAGDFNIDGHTEEFDDLLKNARLDRPDHRLGPPYSFDTTENDVAAYRYPKDPRQLLDHVLLRTGHTRPCATWDNTVIKTTSPSWSAQGHQFTNYSDHYPVLAGEQ